MKDVQIARLTDILRKEGLGWVVDDSRDQGGFTSLDAFIEELARSGHVREQPRSVEDVIAEYEDNPHRVAAFLQAFAASCSPRGLVVAWLLLHGWDLERLVCRYHRHREFQMDVAITASEGRTHETSLTDPFDLALLRHVGIAKADGLPILDGFYALRVADTSGHQPSA